MSSTCPQLSPEPLSEAVWEQCLQRLRDELTILEFYQWISGLVLRLETTAEIPLRPMQLILCAPNAYIFQQLQDHYWDIILKISARVQQVTGLLFQLELSNQLFLQTDRSSKNESHGFKKNEIDSKTLKNSEELHPIHLKNKEHFFIAPNCSSSELNLIQPIFAKSSVHVAPAKSGFRQKSSDVSGFTQPHLPWSKPPSRIQTANLIPHLLFDNFVQGRSNQLARAAALQVAMRPGRCSFNPLLLYGPSGFGKTHLIQAIGNHLSQQTGPGSARALYLHSEQFVAEMIQTLKNNSIEEFKRFYRSLDVLLIDDIQFFSGKDRSQEEFFYTLNALLEAKKQIVVTSDRFPKEIQGLEDRLLSRFGSGLTVAIEPPELETRIEILYAKARGLGIELSPEVAFFIAKRVQSNVRELEGALKRVVANAEFMHSKITLDLVQEVLKDLISLQERLVSAKNIVKTVSEYYKLKLTDLLSGDRSRMYSRPRQIAMALCKELTSHSLSEIGKLFGGKDHTTVLHGCRRIASLTQKDANLLDDWMHLKKILTV